MVRSANERSNCFWIGLVIWATLSAILISMELGVIAFVYSVFLLIWFFGLRDKFEGETIASAYSVFNKDGKSLPGSLTAHDVDKQVRSGGMNVSDDFVVSKGQPESKPSSLKFTGFASNQSKDERDRRRRAAADAATRRRKGI